ncbi:MAG: FtsX-like permease family protein [Armatimonadetes bacterium]|nr:FtsX-like permease family protein [Armatimonadota bacterium]
MFDRLTFILGETLVSIRRNFGMVILGILTVSVCLYITGGLTLTYRSILTYGQGLTGRFEMRVYLQDGTSKYQISDIAKQIRAMDGVATVNWIPKDLAWEKMKRENPELTRDLNNVLPDAYKVVLTDLSKGDAIAKTIQAIPQVEPGGVRYLRNAQKQVDDLLRFLKWIGLVAGGLLALISGVLIFTVVRLTAMSRRLELRIMNLVGASYATIYTPLMLEGVFQGLVGGLAASLLLQLSYHELARVVHGYEFLAELPPFPGNQVMVACSIAGGTYGLICSLLALVSLQRRIA